jgi:hypothetical protein
VKSASLCLSFCVDYFARKCNVIEASILDKSSVTRMATKDLKISFIMILSL